MDCCPEVFRVEEDDTLTLLMDEVPKRLRQKLEEAVGSAPARHSGSRAEASMAEPAVPVPAATIILLRDGPSSPEVLLVERSVESEFLPRLYVFPGGRVDDEDRELVGRLDGVDAESASRVPSLDPQLALCFLVAAIRETYEETGIVLARRVGRARSSEPRSPQRSRRTVSRSRTTSAPSARSSRPKISSSQRTSSQCTGAGSRPSWSRVASTRSSSLRARRRVRRQATTGSNPPATSG